MRRERIVMKPSVLVLGLVLSLLSGAVEATDCSRWKRFAASEPYLRPLSVPAADIGAHLTASVYSEGIEFVSTLRGTELWLDITRFPGATSAAGAPRAILHVGRLADEAFDTLVLADGQEGKFTITEPELRRLGCRFIWGREGGENPIALLREMYQVMRHYETGHLLSRRFTGHLLGDTSLAMDLNNTLLIPQWALSAVDQ